MPVVVAVVSGAVVVHRDAQVKAKRIDDALAEKVVEATRVVEYDAVGVPRLDAAADPEVANGYPQVYVVAIPATGDPEVVVTPPEEVWPGAPVTDAARRALDHGATVGTSSVVDDIRLRLRAAPVPDPPGSTSASVVAVASDVGNQEAHDSLVRWVWLVCGVLAVLGALAALVLSRLALRPLRMVFSQQDELIDAARHELGRPLARLQAAAESGLAGDEPPEEALLRVVRIAGDTAHAIDDLTTIAGLVAGSDRIEAEPVRLDELVEQVLAERLDDTPVRADLEPTSVEGHEGLLRRAALNLVDNAVRHGRNADVVVTVRQGAVTVSDRGPGIEPDRLAAMLRAVNSGSQAEGLGLGLGLMMTSWITRLHGGVLFAENRREGGLAVTVTLPISSSGAPHGEHF